jgi:nitrogen regulatory protein P-II 1
MTMTKKIEAFIREEKLDDVKKALYDLGILGMNVVEVHGHGRQGGVTLAWRTSTYKVDMLPRYQLNIILSDHNVEKTIETIRKAAVTGQPGDGIIFVYPVEDVIRIRTNERGPEALTYEGDIDNRREGRVSRTDYHAKLDLFARFNPALMHQPTPSAGTQPW